MRMLRSSQADFEKKLPGRIVRDRRESDAQVARDVAAILNEVRERGDKALVEYTSASTAMACRRMATGDRKKDARPHTTRSMMSFAMRSN